MLAIIIRACDIANVKGARIQRFDLLVLDELGNIPFSVEAAQLLFQVLADRYEQESVLITTILPLAEWTQVFQDDSLTAALLDRLTRRCQIFEFDWESIRFTESLKQRRKFKKPAVTATAPPSGARRNATKRDPEPPFDGYLLFFVWVGHFFLVI